VRVCTYVHAHVNMCVYVNVCVGGNGWVGVFCSVPGQALCHSTLQPSLPFYCFLCLSVIMTEGQI